MGRHAAGRLRRRGQVHGRCPTALYQHPRPERNRRVLPHRRTDCHHQTLLGSPLLPLDRKREQAAVHPVVADSFRPLHPTERRPGQPEQGLRGDDFPRRGRALPPQGGARPALHAGGFRGIQCHHRGRTGIHGVPARHGSGRLLLGLLCPYPARPVQQGGLLPQRQQTAIPLENRPRRAHRAGAPHRAHLGAVGRGASQAGDRHSATAHRRKAAVARAGHRHGHRPPRRGVAATHALLHTARNLDGQHHHGLHVATHDRGGSHGFDIPDAAARALLEGRTAFLPHRREATAGAPLHRRTSGRRRATHHRLHQRQQPGFRFARRAGPSPAGRAAVPHPGYGRRGSRLPDPPARIPTTGYRRRRTVRNCRRGEFARRILGRGAGVHVSLLHHHQAVARRDDRATHCHGGRHLLPPAGQDGGLDFDSLPGRTALGVAGDGGARDAGTCGGDSAWPPPSIRTASTPTTSTA